jgi:hypothetical protein
MLKEFSVVLRHRTNSKLQCVTVKAENQGMAKSACLKKHQLHECMFVKELVPKKSKK